MALCSDAAMVLYYDIDGNTADHDDWHTYEHLHERLSIPGFLRATRWVANGHSPKYMVIYEVSGTDIANSPAYLERLNQPTPWTTAMMGRFRGMVRGFCTIVAGAGFGIGNTAVSVRITPAAGKEAALQDWLAQDIFPAMASRRGMAGVHLLQAAPPPPMTKEQAIRGQDQPMAWLILATAYDADALHQAIADHLEPDALAQHGAAPGMTAGAYALHYTVTAQEVRRTKPNPPRHPEQHGIAG